MSDFPFSIPRRGDGDVVNGVSYAGDTLTLTRAEGSDLTTTIATSDPTKIENGTSSMEIDTADGACVFTPNGDATKTTTFAADGTITATGNITSSGQLQGFSGKITRSGVGAATLTCESTGLNQDAEVDIVSVQRANNVGFVGGYNKIRSDGGDNEGGLHFIKMSNDGTTSVSTMLILIPSGGYFSSQVFSAGTALTSDDRIKENEKLIVNATETLSKLTPQIYDKYRTMDLSGSFLIESGLIAQELYYNAPELRHLVTLGKDTDASGNEYTPTPEEMDLSDVDIGSDPDYGSHGWSKTQHSSLDYNGLIAYLIKSNQEMAERLAALENK